MKKLMIPGVAALALLCSPPMHAQTVVRERTTTTTVAPAPVEVAGTVTEFAPDTVIIREKDAADPVRFSFSKKVVYVDEAGNPVAREVIRSGVPITVRYIREGDQMLVDRVIVHRAVEPSTVTSETTTTTTTVTGREAKEIQKLRDKIAHEERELSEHPDRRHLQDDLDRDRAALERMQRDLQR